MMKQVKLIHTGPSTYPQVARLTSTGRLGGRGGVRESQDSDVRMGNLGQNQNNVLKKTNFTYVDNRT